MTFLITFHTGMRASEVCALIWGKVDLKNNIFYVKYNLNLLQ
ncbi:hypothetical protein [Sebaldella termitidis]